MEPQAAPQDTQLTADARIYNLGYSRGYEDGQENGRWRGEEDFQGWLIAELRDMQHDLRLHLRSDLATPESVLAAVVALVAAGQPIGVEDEAEE